MCSSTEIFAQHYPEDLHALNTFDALDGFRWKNVDRLRITISLDLLVLCRKLFSEAHDETCSNSAETVDRADAVTIKMCHPHTWPWSWGGGGGVHLYVGNHKVER